MNYLFFPNQPSYFFPKNQKYTPLNNYLEKKKDKRDLWNVLEKYSKTLAKIFNFKQFHCNLPFNSVFPSYLNACKWHSNKQTIYSSG